MSLTHRSYFPKISVANNATANFGYPITSKHIARIITYENNTYTLVVKRLNYDNPKQNDANVFSLQVLRGKDEIVVYMSNLFKNSECTITKSVDYDNIKFQLSTEDRPTVLYQFYNMQDNPLCESDHLDLSVTDEVDPQVPEQAEDLVTFDLSFLLNGKEHKLLDIAAELYRQGGYPVNVFTTSDNSQPHYIIVYEDEDSALSQVTHGMGCCFTDSDASKLTIGKEYVYSQLRFSGDALWFTYHQFGINEYIKNIIIQYVIKHNSSNYREILPVLPLSVPQFFDILYSYNSLSPIEHEPDKVSNDRINMDREASTGTESGDDELEDAEFPDFYPTDENIYDELLEKINLVLNV